MTDPLSPVAISYSGGSSSEWMVRAVIRGDIPRPDRLCVVFADTHDEHAWTYEAVREVRTACEDAEIEFITCSAETRLGDDLIALRSVEGIGTARADHPPLWISKGTGRGKAIHKCTKHYKVAPMRRAVSDWLERNGWDKHVTKWVGFAADEAHRASRTVGKQDVQWERLWFPAIAAGVGRAQQRADLVAWTGRAPRFSMCVFCPFKSPRRWEQTGAEDLARAIEVDEAIRDLDCIGLTDGPAFLTDRLIPIERLVATGDPQPILPGLESYCDAGACFL